LKAVRFQKSKELAEVNFFQPRCKFPQGVLDSSPSDALDSFTNLAAVSEAPHVGAKQSIQTRVNSRAYEFEIGIYDSPYSLRPILPLSLLFGFDPYGIPRLAVLLPIRLASLYSREVDQGADHKGTERNEECATQRSPYPSTTPLQSLSLPSWRFFFGVVSFPRGLIVASLSSQSPLG